MCIRDRSTMTNHSKCVMKNQDAMTDYAAGGFLKRAKPIAGNSFPATLPLGKFLFEYLYRRGVRHCFGIPGDFALPTFTLSLIHISEPTRLLSISYAVF